MTQKYGIFLHLTVLTLFEICQIFGFVMSHEAWNDVRLVNGRTPYEGRVEVKVNGTWGTVCDDEWSMFDGYVVCRQLGYNGVRSVYSQASFGQGTGPIFHDDLQCARWETTLSECPGLHDPAKVDCVHSEDAGVSCIPPAEMHASVPIICRDSQFKCSRDSKCIPRSWLCDGRRDCHDGSDELQLFCNRDCGMQMVPPVSHRIVGGSNAKPGSWPWMTSLKIEFQGGVSDSHLCGATLIDKNWVLTAAHCFKKYRPKSSSLRVVVGDQNNIHRDPTEETILIQRVVIHTNYNPATHENDIALIKLAHSVDTSSSYVKPACLPTFGDSELDLASKCYVTGWGETMKGTAWNGMLQQAMVPLLNKTLCNRWYNHTVKDDMICAGYQFGGIDSCKGDSGGPLSCERNGRWYVAGIISWGEGCGQAQHPGVYTNVAHFVSWIADVLQRNNYTIDAQNIVG
ncbi:neurotrypsin-like [Mercenaria mercenaria]|uniref:neurotrypsin-like n=1 Tax=Mercenaria mercenaria TaxID=6596 RepID=UPI00234EC22B|nr:neurotrypsin-like [Mercenaria mercenaria]